MVDIKKVTNIIQTDESYGRLYTEYGDRLIHLGVSGSHAYGCETEDSDLDIRGITLNTSEDILLMRNPSNIHMENDVVIYPIHRYIDLLANGNMSAIELLGTPTLFKSDIMCVIEERQKLLLSNICHDRTFGYMYSIYREIEKKMNGSECLLDNSRIAKKLSTMYRVAKTTEHLMLTGKVMVYDEQLSKELVTIRNGYYKDDALAHARKMLKGLDESLSKALDNSVLRDIANMDVVKSLKIGFSRYTIDNGKPKDCFANSLSNRKEM